jgi:hypothetical protein
MRVFIICVFFCSDFVNMFNGCLIELWSLCPHVRLDMAPWASPLLRGVHDAECLFFVSTHFSPLYCLF